MCDCVVIIHPGVVVVTGGTEESKAEAKIDPVMAQAMVSTAATAIDDIHNEEEEGESKREDMKR